MINKSGFSKSKVQTKKPTGELSADRSPDERVAPVLVSFRKIGLVVEKETNHVVATWKVKEWGRKSMNCGDTKPYPSWLSRLTFLSSHHEGSVLVLYPEINELVSLI